MRSRDETITNAKPIPGKQVQGKAKAKGKSKAEAKREGTSAPQFDIKSSKVW